MEAKHTTMHKRLTDTVAWLDREIAAQYAALTTENSLKLMPIERLEELRDDLAETLRKIGEG